MDELNQELTLEPGQTPERKLVQDGLTLEPDETPEAREARARLFIEGLNNENEMGSIPAPDPLPYGDPIGYLIDRVDRVVMESVQGGTEPLSTKAAVLATLFQARALQEIATNSATIASEITDMVRFLHGQVKLRPDPDQTALQKIAEDIHQFVDGWPIAITVLRDAIRGLPLSEKALQDFTNQLDAINERNRAITILRDAKAREQE